MKWQILFSRKNKKTIMNLLSAELAKRVVKVNGNGGSAVLQIKYLKYQDQSDART